MNEWFELELKWFNNVAIKILLMTNFKVIGVEE